MSEQKMPFEVMKEHMKQARKDAKETMAMIPKPDFKSMNEVVAQIAAMRVNQIMAYNYQMMQTGATMLQQLYMEHSAMVQKAAEQDQDMLKQLEKAFKKEEKAEEKADK
ncbi:MAG: hypothetical protein IJG85_08885 [Eubacteriaceae bacterium]|nr:hypothetical protein [Eubacteriaceae bacterium]